MNYLTSALIAAAGQPWALHTRYTKSVEALITRAIKASETDDSIRVQDLCEMFTVMAADAVYDGGDFQPLAQVIRVPGSRNGQGVAIVSVKGMVLFDLEFQPFFVGMAQLASTMRSLTADKEIGTIILNIDSPGGTVTGVEEAANEIFAARQKKRVIAVVNPLAASAAYHLASQAGEIVMMPSGSVGSIGVYMLHVDFSGMLENAGIKPTFIKAGKFKTDGNPYEPLSQEAIDNFQKGVDTFYQSFIKAVARGRSTSVSAVRNGMGQGSMVLAKEAITENMVDRIATFDVALRTVGLVPSGVTGRAEYNRIEPEALLFRQDYDEETGTKTTYAVNEWPDCIKATMDLLNGSDLISFDGKEVIFTVANGSAHYQVLFIDEKADGTLVLINEEGKEPEWEPAPERDVDEEEATEAEAEYDRIQALIIRQRRLALHKIK